MLPTGGGPSVGGQDLGQAELAGGLDLLQSQGFGEDGEGGEKIGQGRHLKMGPVTAQEGRSWVPWVRARSPTKEVRVKRFHLWAMVKVSTLDAKPINAASEK